jgi:hypothetical protein
MSAAQIPVGFIARLSTRHFDFEAHGTTEALARAAMHSILRKHATECGLPKNWADPWLADDLHISQFIPGAGFRDAMRVI